MADVIFVVPDDGSEIASPDMDWLREMMADGGEEFWCSGNGQASLRHANGTELLIAFAPENGFFPEYVGPERDRWVVHSEDRVYRKVPMWIGGDPIIVAERFFVSPEVMWAILADFCTTGERPIQVNWRRRSELSWSFAPRDHPDVKI